MKVLLMTPPHTNPVGPTLGIAVLSAHIKKIFPEVEVEATDLGLDAIYWLLSEECIQNAIQKLERNLCVWNTQENLNYEEQRMYVKQTGALCVLKSLGREVPNAIQQLKDAECYQDSQTRENANFVINRVLECVGEAYPHTQLNAGDYRTELSPFAISDIENYVNHSENSVYHMFFEKWLNEHDLSDVAMVGLSISFAKQMLPSFLFASKLKQRYPKLLVQIGGSMMAHLNKEHFKPLFQWCDCIVQREGEHPLEHVIKMIQEKKKFGPEMGVLYLDENGELVQCEKMPKVHLEQELTPDFTHFSLKDYLVPSANVPMQVGRSCYWGKCTFCCLNTAFEHKNCWTKVEKLVDDIEKLSKTLGVKTIEFVDDAIPPLFAKRLSEELLRRECKVKWFSYVRFDSGFNFELFQKMHEAGCVGLKFGLESASPRVSKMMNKGIDLNKAAELFEAAKKAGIIPQAGFFFGFPGEKEEDIQKTVEFIEKYVIPNGILSYNGIFRLLKSMPLMQEPEKYGIKEISKWNNKEELMDYYQVEMEMTEDYSKCIHEAEKKLSKLIDKNLTRSVDSRRYWFSGYENAQVKQNITEGYKEQLVISSGFALDEMIVLQDKNNGDFLPGKGIYSQKSYISDGLHEKEILEALNSFRKSCGAQELRKYVYDVEKKKFFEKN